MAAPIKGAIATGVSSRMQPWMALFTILSYVIGVYGISDEKALVLYGMILATLGFVMVNTNKHNEAIKETVIPWLIEQILTTLGKYLAPPEPPVDGEPIIDETEAKGKIIETLQEQVAALEAAQANGE